MRQAGANTNAGKIIASALDTKIKRDVAMMKYGIAKARYGDAMMTILDLVSDTDEVPEAPAPSKTPKLTQAK